jgi:lysophospholipid acyltransferase (LPLAT)-like uncharacterized protein
MPQLLKSGAAQRAGAAVLGAYLDLVLRSTRWTIEGRTYLEPFLGGGAVIVVCWHERLPLLPAFWSLARRANPQLAVSALASRHRDGRLIAAVLARFGIATVHGSSARIRPGAPSAADRGGAAGLRGLLAVLAAGQAVVITPDGPRGPRRQAAPGAAMLAALSGATLLPVSAQTRRRITLGSWDRMGVPLPFGHGALVCLPPMTVPRDAAESCLPGIEAALTRAADRADALCR